MQLNLPNGAPASIALPAVVIRRPRIRRYARAGHVLLRLKTDAIILGSIARRQDAARGLPRAVKQEATLLRGHEPPKPCGAVVHCNGLIANRINPPTKLIFTLLERCAPHRIAHIPITRQPRPVNAEEAVTNAVILDRVAVGTRHWIDLLPPCIRGTCAHAKVVQFWPCDSEGELTILIAVAFEIIQQAKLASILVGCVDRLRSQRCVRHEPLC